MREKYKELRFTYLIFVAILFAFELIIITLVEDNFVNFYVNKVLLIVLIYCFIRIFIPKKIRLLPLYVFLFACEIELLQYFYYYKILGLTKDPVMQAVVGTPSMWVDILCYAIGTVFNSISMFKK
jgi:hypothetical protein